MSPVIAARAVALVLLAGVTLTMPGQLAACTNAAEARDTVLAAVSGGTLIRKEPVPELLLMAMGDGAFTFSLKAFASTATVPAKARSDLLFWLVDEAARAGLKFRTA